MAVDIRRQIPAAFERVEHSKYGYNAKQVDQFFQRARVSFENRGSFDSRGSFENRAGGSEKVNSSDVRAVSFDPVKGGYDATAVDAALDRLEDAFARRERDELVAAEGEEAWLLKIGKLSGVLRGRLHRPDGERFRRPDKKRTRGYNIAEVDALCVSLIGYLENDRPLSVDNVRRAAFSEARGHDGYEEAQVDAFLDRVVELMAAID